MLDSGAPARSTGEDVSLEHVLPVVALTAFAAVKRPVMEKTMIKNLEFKRTHKRGHKRSDSDA